MGFLIAGVCLALSALIVRGLDRMCRKAPLIELSRFAGNDAARAAYESRRDALGLGAVRNVRNAEESA